MSGLVKSAIKQRKITIFLTILILIFGFKIYGIIPKQENPDASVGIARVLTIYPGGTPDDVKNLVTKKLEDAASEIDGFDYVESYSKNSVSVLIVYLKDDADQDKSWRELRQNVEDKKAEIPKECFASEINTDLVSTAGMIISLSGDNYSYDQLDSYAEEIKGKLSKIDGVTRFDVDGKLNKEVKIDIDIERLNNYPISVEDVTKALQAQNIKIPPGAIENESSKIDVITSNGFESVKDIENVIVYISEDTGAVVRLKDIAKIHMAYEDDASKYKQDGKNAILLTGHFEENKNIVLIGKDVRIELDKIKKSLPSDLNFYEVLYQPTDVDNAVSDFMANLVEGIILVVVVIFAGVGIRNSIVVSTALPISILISFVIMEVLGIKIHQISTMALIIALGILVDNAIVISDVVQVKVDEGIDSMKAAFDGAKESAVPIFTSTLTTVASFAPLLTIPGIPGKYVECIPKVVIISLIASYICAMLITPPLASLFFKKTKDKKKGRGITKVRSVFEKLLDFGLKRRRTTIAIAVVLLGLTALLATTLGLEFFPYANKNMMYINTTIEKKGDLKATEKVSADVEKVLKAQPEIKNYTTGIGDGVPKFWVAMPTAVPSNDFSQTKIDFDLKKGERFESNEEFANYLQEQLDTKIVGAKSTVYPLQYAMPKEAPIGMRVLGEDMEKIYSASEKLQAMAREIEGTCKIRDDAAERTYQYKVDIDSDLASELGIMKYDIERQINIALRGTEASVYRKNGKEFSIIVSSNIDTKEKLENLGIKSTLAGHKVLLKEIAAIKLRPQIDTIKRYNKENCVNVYVGVKPGGNAVDIQNIIEEKLKTMDLPGIRIEFHGEKEDIVKYFGKLGVSAGVAIFFIYIILLIQFNSFMQPFIIFLTIPLSFIGAIVGLFIFKQPLSLMALMGIVSLVGIVVKNAILLIEYINKARDEGFSLEDACKDAMSKRFSPIILSAFTTVMGLAPIVASKNPMFVPMAVALMCGLIVSTLLTLVVIPVLYHLIESRSAQLKNKVKQVKMNNGNTLKG
ncbi:efflux RND transporter permease subunit [Clostridium ganghwense]|uniref:Efflux RND transporter permease subunit n=1 Tax=Clostridium ganghwense TaxID=312089 RepID=A0ABT4CPL0_9CLOT|nr:efflux RND transporter permease subunit [Clostridium ganghwense]MCY6370980.1 efflux RND transporter permease subunit [Clostridium ganghwense]